MTQQTAPPLVETSDTLARDVALPGPSNSSRCDADYDEMAVARVYTASGPLDLCGHHLRESMHLFEEADYVVAYSDPELVIDRYRLGD
jgi:hypothetical protein